jgi:CTP:molybdopterin cytidylyltransferase MocA
VSKKHAGGRQKEAKLAVVIMAAGKGTRLKSRKPKVLHEVGGKALLSHVIAAAGQVVDAKDIFIVVGHEAEQVQNAVADFRRSVRGAAGTAWDGSRDPMCAGISRELRECPGALGRCAADPFGDY